MTDPAPEPDVDLDIEAEERRLDQLHEDIEATRARAAEDLGIGRPSEEMVDLGAVAPGEDEGPDGPPLADRP